MYKSPTVNAVFNFDEPLLSKTSVRFSTNHGRPSVSLYWRRSTRRTRSIADLPCRQLFAIWPAVAVVRSCVPERRVELVAEYSFNVRSGFFSGLRVSVRLMAETCAKLATKSV